ncbi:MAG TPA: glycoside hydrolase [Prolixibacteraceae bacterium]|nr:glycoside hydrolase [Prolixibacteraceae bacterium]
MQKIFLIIFLLIFAVLPENAVGQPSAIKKQQNNKIPESEIRETLITFAKGFLGVPYLYASAAPEKGFDCSGFVHFVFKNFNINVPHSSRGFQYLGKLVQPEEFKVGDVLVFYGYRNTTQIGHVGIICEADGLNSKFIHSSSGKTKGVIISKLNSEMYSRRFYQCVDIISEK